MEIYYMYTKLRNEFGRDAQFDDSASEVRRAPPRRAQFLPGQSTRPRARVRSFKPPSHPFPSPSPAPGSRSGHLRHPPGAGAAGGLHRAQPGHDDGAVRPGAVRARGASARPPILQRNPSTILFFRAGGAERPSRPPSPATPLTPSPSPRPSSLRSLRVNQSTGEHAADHIHEPRVRAQGGRVAERGGLHGDGARDSIPQKD